MKINVNTIKKVKPKHWLIAMIALVVVVGVIYVSTISNKADKELGKLQGKLSGNDMLKQRFKNYDSLSYSEQKALWAIVYDKCPHYKAATRQQMKKWGRSYPEQLAAEIDWELGGNPAGVNRNALSEVTKKGRCPNFLETL